MFGYRHIYTTWAYGNLVYFFIKKKNDIIFTMVITFLDIKTIKQFHEHIKCSPRPYTPKFKDRIILLGFGNIAVFIICFIIIIPKYFISGFFINFVLALTNVIVPDLYENFPSYLLALFIANLILYLFFYLIMKFISKERMYFESYLYLIIAMVCWCAALYYYNIKISFWDVNILFLFNQLNKLS